MSSGERMGRIDRWSVASAVVGLACIGCTGDRDPDASTTDDPPAVAIVVADRDRSPFCTAMLDLADRLAGDPPDDIAAVAIETYERILDDVPAAIRPEFDYVLAVLRGEPVPDLPEPTAPPPTEPPTTLGSVPATEAPGPATSAPGSTDPEPDEFHRAPETPAERISTYVDFHCSGTLNNPGPPPTEPPTEPPDPDP